MIDMNKPMTKSSVIERCGELKKYWNRRNKKFKDWYRLIQMVDDLEQEDMESFVGNDPRSSFMLILSLLDDKIPHKITAADLEPDKLTSVIKAETLFNTAWDDIYSGYRLRGRQSWQRDAMAFMLATGWYSIFSMITQDGKRCIAEIWNPATVYPNWDYELVECAHVFSLSKESAIRMAAKNNWDIGRLSGGNITINDYWRKVDGRVYNSICLGSTLVKPETMEPRMSRIPVFVTPRS